MSDTVWNFRGRRFAVIGASSGVGRQTALELAAAGAEVLAIARNQERLNELAEQSPLITAATLDVMKADSADWAEVLGAYVREHGKLHGGVYTAGIVGLTPLRGFDENLARNIMETSFWGAVYAIQGLSKRSVSLPEASFVLFSSLAWKSASKGLFAYAAAKAALVAAVKSFAHELAHERKRINTISPGFMTTEMTRASIDEIGSSVHAKKYTLFGLGKAQDVTGMTLFLLSGRAKWITGEDLVVDGGYQCGVWE